MQAETVRRICLVAGGSKIFQADAPNPDHTLSKSPNPLTPQHFPAPHFSHPAIHPLSSKAPTYAR